MSKIENEDTHDLTVGVSSCRNNEESLPLLKHHVPIIQGLSQQSGQPEAIAQGYWQSLELEYGGYYRLDLPREGKIQAVGKAIQRAREGRIEILDDENDGNQNFDIVCLHCSSLVCPRRQKLLEV